MATQKLPYNTQDLLARGEAMMAQTKAEGSKPFAGSSYETDYKAGKYIASPIPAASMNPATPVAIPPAPVPTNPGSVVETNNAILSGGATNEGLAYDPEKNKWAYNPPAQESPTDDKYGGIFASYMNSLSKPPETLGIYEDERKRLGMEQKEKVYSKYSAQLNSIVANRDANILRAEGNAEATDLTKRTYDAQVSRIMRDAAIEALPVQAQLAAAQGDLQMAQQTLNTMFEIRSKDSQAQWQWKQQVASSLFEYMNASEKRRMDKIMLEEDRRFQQERDNLNLVNQWAQMAVQTGQSGLISQFTALDPSSPTFNQDFGKLQAQVRKPVEPRNRPTSVIDVNGQKYLIDTQTGDIISTYGFGEGGAMSPEQQQQVLVRDASTIQTLDSLKIDPGMKKSVGTWALARWTPLRPDVTTGQVSNFISTVDQLTKDLTLDKLISAKAEGATFGALSDAELRLLSDSASRINSWRRTDEGGNTTHYQTSEKMFKKELDTISNFRKLDYILKGGNPFDVGVQIMPDGTAWSLNSDGTLTQLQ